MEMQVEGSVLSAAQMDFLPSCFYGWVGGTGKGEGSH